MRDIGRERIARLDFAREIAEQAGAVTLRYFGDSSLRVDRKEDQSPVTVADREAERYLRQAIAERFPEDSVTGEEFGTVVKSGSYHWVLDPIDGTKSFVCGVPLYGTLVAVLEEDRPVIGIIQLPALRECVWGMVGGGAWHQQGDRPPQTAHVSHCQRLADAVFVTSERRSFDSGDAGKAYSALESQCRITRTWGDCYGYALVATGRADVMIDPQLQIWDAAAMMPILREAGGQFTDWQGRARCDTGNGIGTNSLLLAEVIAVLAGPPPDTGMTRRR